MAFFRATDRAAVRVQTKCRIVKDMRLKWVPRSFFLVRCLWRSFVTDLVSVVFSCVGQRVRRATSVEKLTHLLWVVTTEAPESKKLGLNFSHPFSCFKNFSCVLKHPKWAYYAGKPVKNMLPLQMERTGRLLRREWASQHQRSDTWTIKLGTHLRLHWRITFRGILWRWTICTIS